jgi:transcription termination factor NusB
MPAIHDGRSEIARAIAAVSSLVQLNLTTDPVTTDPEDLFDHKFNDPQVGIDDGQMIAFKRYLQACLPGIYKNIDQIPENANQVIDDVAEAVRLALLAAGARA